MRQNVRIHNPEELYTAQLRRSIALKQVQPVHPDDAAIEAFVYFVVLGIVWTAVLLTWWLL